MRITQQGCWLAPLWGQVQSFIWVPPAWEQVRGFGGGRGLRGSVLVWQSPACLLLSHWVAAHGDPFVKLSPWATCTAVREQLSSAADKHKLFYRLCKNSVFVIHELCAGAFSWSIWGFAGEFWAAAMNIWPSFKICDLGLSAECLIKMLCQSQAPFSRTLGKVFQDVPGESSHWVFFTHFSFFIGSFRCYWNVTVEKNVHF